jgi:putative toxin-antitoxin system antitoxin component (TIGR02293 family)
MKAGVASTWYRVFAADRRGVASGSKWDYNEWQMKPALIALRAKKAPHRPAAKKALVPTAAGQRIASTYSKDRHGMVLYYIRTALGRRLTYDVPVWQQIKATEAGLPESELTDLQTSLDVSSERIFSLVGLSKATFHRRKATGTNLSPLVSDRVVRFALLLSKAIKILGSEDDAKKWMNSPQFGLGGAVPLDYAKTEVGANEVENLLGRIEYGVYT